MSGVVCACMQSVAAHSPGRAWTHSLWNLLLPSVLSGSTPRPSNELAQVGAYLAMSLSSLGRLADIEPALQARVATFSGNVAALRCVNLDLKLASRPALEAKLLAAASQSAHGHSRATALTGLATIFGDSCAALGLAVVALKDPDQQLREAAIAVLPCFARGAVLNGSQGRRAAFEAGLSSLKDSAWGIRAGALRVLPELAPEAPCSALPEVARCLEDPEWVVRTAAVAALCRMVAPGRGKVAVEAAAARLEHSDRRVREAAGDSLAQLATTNGECVVHAVERACSHGDARIRRAALQVLDSIAESAASNKEVRLSLVRLAVAYLDDPAGSVREAALRALGRLATPEDAALAVAMAPHLTDDDPHVQGYEAFPHVRAAAGIAMQRATAKLDANFLPELLFFETPAVLRQVQGLLQGKCSSRRDKLQEGQACVIC